MQHTRRALESRSSLRLFLRSNTCWHEPFRECSPHPFFPYERSLYSTITQHFLPKPKFKVHRIPPVAFWAFVFCFHFFPLFHLLTVIAQQMCLALNYCQRGTDFCAPEFARSLRCARTLTLERKILASRNLLPKFEVLPTMWPPCLVDCRDT